MYSWASSVGIVTVWLDDWARDFFTTKFRPALRDTKLPIWWKIGSSSDQGMKLYLHCPHTSLIHVITAQEKICCSQVRWLKGPDSEKFAILLDDYCRHYMQLGRELTSWDPLPINSLDFASCLQFLSFLRYEFAEFWPNLERLCHLDRVCIYPPVTLKVMSTLSVISRGYQSSGTPTWRARNLNFCCFLTLEHCCHPAPPVDCTPVITFRIIWLFIWTIVWMWPPLWSSGQSFWLQIQRS
jgi:hypothetical protein